MFAGNGSGGRAPHSGSTSRSRSILPTLDSRTCQTHNLARPPHYIRKEQAFVDFDLSITRGVAMKKFNQVFATTGMAEWRKRMIL